MNSESSKPTNVGSNDQLGLQPVAWLCLLAEEDGSVRHTVVQQDPAGLRFNDAGLPSPFSTRPLFSAFQIEMAARAVIADYKASGDEDLDKLVRRALHDLVFKFGAWIEIEA